MSDKMLACHQHIWLFSYCKPYSTLSTPCFPQQSSKYLFRTSPLFLETVPLATWKQQLPYLYNASSCPITISWCWGFSEVDSGHHLSTWRSLGRGVQGCSLQSGSVLVSNQAVSYKSDTAHQFYMNFPLTLSISMLLLWLFLLVSISNSEVA